VIEVAFDKMYVGNDSISRAYRDGRQSRMRLITELTQDMTEATPVRRRRKDSPTTPNRLARLIGRDPTIRVAFLALGGWDTHVNQGAANGQLAGHSEAARRGPREPREVAWAELPGHRHASDLRIWPHDARERQRRH